MSEDRKKNNEETSQQESSSAHTSRRKKKSTPLKIFQIFGFIVTLIVLLIIGIFIFIQTDLFNKWALEFTLDKLNESWKSKDSQIYASDLEGNIFTGITLRNSNIVVKGDTLVTADSITVKYDLWTLLDKEITIEDLILNQPTINLTKIRNNQDSLQWNLLYLFTSEEEVVDTSETIFDWRVVAENVTINNGTVRIVENKEKGVSFYNAEMDRLDEFGLKNLLITDFDLKLNGDYSSGKKIFHIAEMNFNTNSDFKLKNLKFDTELLIGSDTTTSLKNFHLVTDRTNFKINELKMEQLNLLEEMNYDDWSNRQVIVDLVADKFNFKDLSFFLPSLDFMDSTVYLDLKASGKYDDLNISKLDLRLPNSEFHLKGNLKNLTQPSNLLYDITGNDITIDPNDVDRVLPGLEIPDYSNVGMVNISHLTYKGESTRFDSEFDVRTSLAGNARGDIYLDLEQPQIYYRGNATTSNLDIGKIIKDNELRSSLNTELVFDAHGFDPESIYGKINYEMNGSSFKNFKISSSAGQLNFSSGNLQMNIRIASNAMTGQIEGTLRNFMDPQRISYNVKGFSKGLNLGVIANDNSLSSDLNMTFDVNGSGTDPDYISGNFKINLAQSRFQEYILPATPILANLDQRGLEKKIDFSSEFLNLNASGRFSFSALTGLIERNINEITSGITEGLQGDTALKPDTTFFATDYERKTFSTTFDTGSSDLDFKYNLQIKNIIPLSPFTGLDTSTYFSGTINGEIRKSSNIFGATLDGNIKNFRYNDSLLFVKNALLNLDMINDMSGEELNGLDIDFNFFADSVFVFDMNLDSTLINFQMVNSSNKFLISSVSDSVNRIFTTGGIGYAKAPAVFFDSLAVKYGEFRIKNQGDLIVKYYDSEEKQGVEFEKFVLTEDLQRINVDGFYSFNDSSDIVLSADNIDISDYQQFFLSSGEEIEGNIRRIELVFKGTPEDPDIHLEANSDVLKMGGTVLGRLDALIDYNDEVIKPDIGFYNSNNSGSFILTGEIPFQNPIHSPDSVSFYSQPMDLQVDANNFQVKILQQLLPQVTSFEGVLNGQIDVKGTVQDPLLTGSMTVRKGLFTMDMTKMIYGFEIDINTEKEKVVIPYSKIYVPDETDKFITTTGYVDFTDLTIKDMELVMTGDVKVLDKDYGMTSLGIEGDLYIGSGTPSLRISGNNKNLNLSGNLILVNGNVTINPFVNAAYNVYQDEFLYGVIIDSAIAPGDSIHRVLFENPDTMLVSTDRSLNPFEKILLKNTNSSLVKKQLREPQGIFYYDVYVTTTDKLFLTFIVNERTKQEFFGRINTDLYVNNKNPEQKMVPRGVITLGENSYYRFFKKFQADGQVVFNGELTNPLLVIDAEYHTRVPSDEPGEQNLADVTIELKVRGEAKNPTLSISVSKNGVPITGSDATSDAISLLLFGQFKSNLGYSERSSIVGGLGANIGTIFLSDYISSAIETVFPFILNTDVNYVDTKSGTFIDNTDIRFTAELGDAIVRFGGRFLQSINNTDIIIEYPLNRLFQTGGASRNLVLQLERVVDPFTTTTTGLNETRTGALLYYRIKF